MSTMVKNILLCPKCTYAAQSISPINQNYCTKLTISPCVSLFIYLEKPKVALSKYHLPRAQLQKITDLLGGGGELNLNVCMKTDFIFVNCLIFPPCFFRFLLTHAESSAFPQNNK